MKTKLISNRYRFSIATGGCLKSIFFRRDAEIAENKIIDSQPLFTLRHCMIICQRSF